MNWVFILVVLGVVVFVLIKFTDLKHRFRFIFFSFLLIFLVLSIGYVYSANELDLKSSKGIINAGKIYFVWLTQVVSNIIKISGYVIGQDWGINSTDINLSRG